MNSRLFGIPVWLAVMFFATACAHTPAVSANSRAAAQSVFDRVDKDLQAYDEITAQMKTEFSKMPADPKNIEWVKRKIQHMFDVDQYMRKYMMNVPFEKGYTDAEKEYFNKEFGPRFKQIDTENTSDLKGLLKTYRWFTISKFGKVTDNNAWLLVQHADEQPEFQRQVLAILTGLYKSKETRPENYAYLFDRVAASFSDLSKRKLQRYGTQGACTGPGTWAPIPMEEPALVDVRRAEVGLGTMAEYIAVFKDICH